MKRAARDYRPRFECGNPECGHLSIRHERAEGGGRCTFKDCACSRLVIPITIREFEVLRTLAGGGGLKTVAKKLDLSPKTVEAHLSNMRGKTGLGYTMDLILAALRAELLTLADLPASPAGILAVVQRAA